MNYIKHLSAILIVLFTVSCHSSKQYFENEDWINTKAKELYENYLIDYNIDSSLALVYSSDKEKLNPNFRIKFSIFDVINKKVLLSREADNTKVSWYSKTELLLITQLGFIDKKTGVSQKRKIFDVINAKSTTMPKNQK